METVHTAFTMHTWYDACGTLKSLSTHITRSYYFLVENYANPFAMLQGVWYVVVAVLSLLVAVLIGGLYRSVNVSLSRIGRKRLTVINIMRCQCISIIAVCTVCNVLSTRALTRDAS